MSPFNEFHAPRTVDEALGILHEKGSAACVLAGGTDVMVRVRRGLIPAGTTAMVSLHRIDTLRGVREEGEELIIGPATTASDLIRDAVVTQNAPILARVADRLASTQIRNMATVGGNLVNASPAGDLISPLLMLDARLVLASAAGTRTVPVESFFTGPGESVLKAEELLVEIRCGLPPIERIFGFEKAGTRPAMECSVVTVGLAFTPREGLLRDVRVAFGSLAPVPLRGKATEAVMEGQALTPELIQQAGRSAEQEVQPISDLRGSEPYRRVLAGVFLRRLLHG
jgi:CO/xanthine dehydrogenase FAD-binding subunit